MAANDGLLYARAERARQVGTPDERRAAEHARANRFLSGHGALGGQCAANTARCVGGQYCMHALYAALAPEAMLAAARYDYGTDPRQRRALYDRLLATFVTQRVPLEAAVACGLSASLMAFAGLDVRTLISNGYILETVIEQLTPGDWHTLRALGASAADERLFPRVVLRDAFGDAVN